MHQELPVACGAFQPEHSLSGKAAQCSVFEEGLARFLVQVLVCRVKDFRLAVHCTSPKTVRTNYDVYSP